MTKIALKKVFRFHLVNLKVFTFQERHRRGFRKYGGVLWCNLPEIFSYLPAEFPLNSEFRYLTPPSVLEQLDQVVSPLVRELDHGNTKAALR